MATLRQLSEQALRRYKGTINTESKVTLKEVDLMINQLTQTLVKDRFQMRKMDGDLTEQFDIPSALIMTYENQPVSGGDEEQSYVVLPVYPIMLPMDMGIWRVYDPEDPDTIFVPIPNIAEPVFQNTHTQALEGLPGYSVRGKKIFFNENISDDTQSVNIELIVNDFSNIDPETDTYPIPPEMESEVIQLALEQLMQREKNIDEVIDNRDQP